MSETAPETTPEPRPAAAATLDRLRRRAVTIAVATAVLLITIKTGAYLVSGSVAVLASLLDSVMDAAASLVNFLAVRQALTPPDREHRFGHGKAEALAGLAQAAFITGSAGLLLLEAVTRFLDPAPIRHGEIAVVVMLVSLGITLLLVSYQLRVAKKTGSVAIAADAMHYLSDILGNIGVIAGIIMAAYLGMHWADPVIGVLVGLVILHSAWKVGLQSLNQLMDHELDADTRDRIIATAMQVRGVRGVHDLRTRASGPDSFIQMHIDMDANLKLSEAHAIAEAVMQAVEAAIPRSEVLVHEDPVQVVAPPQPARLP